MPSKDILSSTTIDSPEPRQLNVTYTVSPKKDSLIHSTISDYSLPSIHRPSTVEESTLHDPPPTEAVAAPLEITYHIGKSSRGSDQLISSDGYSYNVLRKNKNGTVKWQCVVRNAKPRPSAMPRCASLVIHTHRTRHITIMNLLLQQ